MGEAGALSKKGYQRKKCRGEARSVDMLLIGVCTPVAEPHLLNPTPHLPFLLLDMRLGCPFSGLASGVLQVAKMSGRVGGGDVSQNKKPMNQLASRSAFSK